MLYLRSFAKALVRASVLSTTEISTFTFITRSGFKRPNTRMRVRLLGPCFKTGRLRPLCQHPKHVNVSRSPEPEGRAESLGPKRRIRPESITHPERCHVPRAIFRRSKPMLTRQPGSTSSDKARLIPGRRD